MPLPSSGQISLNDIHTEIGRSPVDQTEVSISDSLITQLGDIAGVQTNGDHSFSDWYGKGNEIEIRPFLDIYTLPESIPNTPTNNPTLVRGSIFGNIGTYFYQLNHISTSDADFTNGNSNFTGTVTITNQQDGANGVTFFIDTIVDEGTTGEADETFEFKVYYGSNANGPLEDTSSPITITSASGPSQWAVSPNSTSVNEGGSTTWTVTGFNIPNGTTYYLHRFAANTVVNADFSTSWPVPVTINNNTGTATITTTADGITEGTEQYTVRLRSTSNATSTLLAGSTQNVQIADTSPNYDVTPASTSVNEGSSLAVGFSGAKNTTYYWTIDYNNSASSADFSVTSGSFTTSSFSGTVTVNPLLTLTADSTTEGNETFYIKMREGSTSGTVVATSSLITINDTSTTAAPAPTELAYYKLTLLGTITGQASYWASTTNSLSAYAGETGRVVFNYTNGPSSWRRYRGDMQFDSISFDGNTYNFDAPSGHDWVTSSSFSGSYAPMDDNDLSTFNNNIRNYASLTTGTTSDRWNVDSGGTPSGSTGLATADSGSYYVYAETSGSGSNNKSFTLASPLVTLSNSVGNLSYAFARYGSNIGSTKVYWAETVSTNPYVGSGTATITGPVTRTSPSSTPNWVDGQYSATNFFTGYGGWPSNANNQTCRLVIAYISGNDYTSDLQLDEWYANATSTSSTSGETPLYIDSSQTQQSSTLTTYTSANFNTTSAPTASDIQTIYNNTVSWTNLSTSASNSYWSIDSGGTSSSNTGLNSLGSGSYTYFEATQTGFSYKMRLLRSKQFTATPNRGFRGRIGAYGAAIGRMRVFVAIE